MNASDKQGRTPLHYAAGDGNAAEVRRLLKAGADANHQDANGWSPLHFAAQASSAECTDALLGSGASPSLQDSHGNTALFRAVFASKGEGDVIMLLRRAGANPRTKNAHGVSPASLARTMANFNVAVHFADLGPDKDDA
ncbi:MAG: ankyrin repeat domain-containing protein [Pseudomonadota bacterium]